jgi:hypothetical protein
MPEQGQRPWTACAVLVAGCVGVACDGLVAEEVGGVDGLAGVLRFEAPTDLVFSEPIGIGSSFLVQAKHLDADAEFDGDVDVGVSNDAVAVEVEGVAGDIVEFRVDIVAGGTVRLAVTEGDEVVDRIDIRAVPIADSVLIDTSLLGFADTIDISLPRDFAFEARDVLRVSVASIDRCNNGVLDLGASTVEVDDTAEIVAAENGTFEIAYDADGDFHDLTLLTPGLGPLTYGVLPAGIGFVDEIGISMVAASGDDGTFTVWGRAFVDGIDVVGVEDFTWAADPRIALASQVGPVITGTVGPVPVNEDGTPGDDAATIFAAAVGEDTALDLLTITTEGSFVGSRGEGPERADPPELEAPVVAGCGGCGEAAPVCDPLAALLPIWGLRRLRRRGAHQHT